MTDGSYPFAGLGPVSKMISAEDSWVDKQTKTPAVTVAYVVPLDKENPDLVQQLRHELEGAFLAQYKANHTSSAGDVPLIRLLVVNTGARNEQWEPVAVQLRGAAKAVEHPLVGVLGFGESRDTVAREIESLTDSRATTASNRDPIPVVAVRLTADDLGTGSSPASVQGLVRVAPTNSDEAAAASAFLKQEPFHRALIVQDLDKTDLYAQSLGHAFASQFPDATHTLLTVERYNSSLQGVADTFVQMLPNICQQRPDVIYFAGRGTDLKKLLAVLPTRACITTHFTIVTGDDAVSLSPAIEAQLSSGNHELQEGLLANTTLMYTALAHPDEWGKAPAFFNRAAAEPFSSVCTKSCFIGFFPTESLSDGAAIMAYDALNTTVSAAREPAARQQQSPRGIRSAITQGWNVLNGCRAVAGASGWISLNDLGNPDNKAMPILELEPTGAATFKQLASPLGQPFVPPLGC